MDIESIEKLKIIVYIEGADLAAGDGIEEVVVDFKEVDGVVGVMGFEGCYAKGCDGEV